MTNDSNALKIEVRPAVARDAAAIARLAGELGYPSTAEQARERLAAMEEDPRHATFVAAVTGDEVIGWIHLCEVRSLGIRAEITDLVMDSRSRSAGAGRLLVERGEQWARERGLAVIGVHSNVIRELRTRSIYGSDTPSRNLKKYFGKRSRPHDNCFQTVTAADWHFYLNTI